MTKITLLFNYNVVYPLIYSNKSHLYLKSEILSFMAFEILLDNIFQGTMQLHRISWLGKKLNLFFENYF